MATKEYTNTIKDVKNLIQKLEDLQKETNDVRRKCLSINEDIIGILGDGYRLLEFYLKDEGEL